jgi:hypothetical protein
MAKRKTFEEQDILEIAAEVAEWIILRESRREGFEAWEPVPAGAKEWAPRGSRETQFNEEAQERFNEYYGAKAYLLNSSNTYP